MDWKTSSYNAGDEKTELAYDLRQGLARRLDEILNQIADARYNRSYEDWFKLLDNLYIEICKKLKQEEMNEYNLLLEEANEIIEKNPKAYAREFKGGEDSIYEILKKVNIWLERKMERYKMFGAKDEPEDF